VAVDQILLEFGERSCHEKLFFRLEGKVDMSGCAPELQFEEHFLFHFAIERYMLGVDVEVAVSV